jgi:hypothetical protein
VHTMYRKIPLDASVVAEAFVRGAWPHADRRRRVRCSGGRISTCGSRVTTGELVMAKRGDLMIECASGQYLLLCGSSLESICFPRLGDAESE